MLHLKCGVFNEKKNFSIAHIRQGQDNAEQALSEHILAVAENTKRHAESVGLASAGYLIGLLHDFGKYSAQFQKYICSCEGLIDQDSDDFVNPIKHKGRIDHSTAGAQHLWQSYLKYPKCESYAQMLALCIASHHSGLIDCLSPEGEDVFINRFAKNNELDENSFQISKTTDKGHGRLETRSYFCLDTSYYPLSRGEGFKDINSIIQVSRVRETSKGQTCEKQYYISSLPCDAEQLGSVVRGHWAIENSLHHVLDVNYCEDDNRTRKDHAPANFSMLRKCALSLINLHKDEKLTQKKARTRARLNHSYAIMLLVGKPVKEI